MIFTKSTSKSICAIILPIKHNRPFVAVKFTTCSYSFPDFRFVIINFSTNHFGLHILFHYHSYGSQMTDATRLNVLNFQLDGYWLNSRYFCR